MYKVVQPHIPHAKVGLLTLFFRDVLRIFSALDVQKKECNGGNLTTIDYLENGMDEICDMYDSQEVSNTLIIPHKKLVSLLYQWEDLVEKEVEYITVVEENGIYCLEGSHEPPQKVREYRHNKPQSTW